MHRSISQIGLAVAVFSGAVLLGARAAPAADLDNGRKIARQHCARCHVVGDFNPMGGISSTPSFYLLVRVFKDWRERFETFYARRPHPAFLSIKGVGRLRADLPPNAHPVVLEAGAVADLIAYVETLRKKPAKGAGGKAATATPGPAN